MSMCVYSFLFRLFRFFVASTSFNHFCLLCFFSPFSFLSSYLLSLISYPPLPSSIFSFSSSVSSAFSSFPPLLSSRLPFFFSLCRFYRFFHLFSYCSFRLSRFLPLSPLSFSSVKKPGQSCLLLVFIPTDVSTFSLFCPKARLILGCLSQPPD